MYRPLTAAALATAMAVSGPAMAGEAAKAEITSLKGAVAVSQSGRLYEARAGQLCTGDRVIARDGEARLIYADGCTVTLRSGAMATIGAKSPCVDAKGLVTAGPANAQSSISELTPFGMAMGVLAVGGFLYGVGSLISNQDNDDTRSVSP
jgi:uncharacterized membrane protein